MSKTISRILDQPERTVTKIIQKLEDKNGYPSHDVRHLSENIQKIRSKIAELGLDPDDTTAEELYHALLIRFQNDSRRFDEQFGVHQKNFDDKIDRAVELVSKNVSLPERWVLKTSAAKALLRRQPPKKVMRQLHYRSVDSLLKRESLAEIYPALGFMESPSWNKLHAKAVSALDSTAFEMRPAKLVALTATKWGRGSGINQLFNDEYGVAGLEPSDELERAGLLSMSVLLLDELANFGQIKTADVVRLSPAAAWWSDMDGLISILGSKPVSLNPRDTAENSLAGASFADRKIEAGQRGFWQNLLSRYQNQLAPEEDILADLTGPFKRLAAPTPQPAFEYVEDV